MRVPITESVKNEIPSGKKPFGTPISDKKLTKYFVLNISTAVRSNQTAAANGMDAISFRSLNLSIVRIAI